MTGPLLSLRGVSRRYAGSAGAPALDSVDLDLHAGEFVAVVGRSGAGKSTLLNVLGLLDSADAGEYRIAGLDVATLAEAERDALRSRTFGFVFQDSFVLPNETVARNAALPLRMRGEARDAQIGAVAEVLDEFGLLPLAEQPAGTLSGGERQRTALARAIVGRPAVILADEPTGDLDSGTTAVVMDLLVELHRSGVTVVLITHSAEVAAVAERTVRIADGRMESDTGATGAGEPRTGSPADGDSPTRASVRAPRARRRAGWLLGDAVSALLLSPARTVGILAAFVIAVAGLVTSVGMSATAAQQITQRLDSAALDQVTVRMPAVSSTEDLRRAAEAIGSLDGVLAASPRTTLPAAVARPERWIGGSSVTTDAPVLAVDRAFLDALHLSVAPRTAADWLDVEDTVPVALLGRGAADDLGIPTTRTGDTIRIAGQAVTVAGFVTSTPRDPALAESILVSLTDLTVPPQSDLHVVARTVPGRPAAIAESIPLAVDPGRPETVVVQTVADLRLLTRGVSSDLAANLLVISAVLLLLVCFSSATSMFLTVSARTREIALRRAVGATRRDIRGLFLVEGTAIGVAGGLSGAALGTLTTTVLSALQGWSPVVDPTSALVGVAAGVGAGALSAVGPALRAARVEPALALRAG
ncbi:macrolide transport system ATP-binding/permease protein [Rathayibacter oskolensis]|uniref:Macrolide transport system ATP-binding/permease protein n=1 Tax=Rathayibacter oskolensis TaxID=1891671 RepID=A0A1X7P6Z1_9MICO|nr:ATP-binding cassette domain-containing protein [Rathayibacter oskolensis]SMH45856.1 macrolide transport system ATP-binding/permease protein [Rathayibacter oskolensis]